MSNKIKKMVSSNVRTNNRLKYIERKSLGLCTYRSCSERSDNNIYCLYHRERFKLNRKRRVERRRNIDYGSMVMCV